MQKSPSFEDLAKKIASGTGLSLGEGESLDAFLGRIADKGINIQNEAIKHLQTNSYNDVHDTLLSFFTLPSEIKLITTNFDLLFEKCALDKKIEIPRIFSAPAMPLGRSFSGLVHLHGEIQYSANLVLDSRAFGEAYITDGWASSFLRDVCQHYTILFVGYSHKDPIMNYFSRAVSKREEKQRYILTFDGGMDWKCLGLNPIFFEKENYKQQQESLRELSNILRADYFTWETIAKDILANTPSSINPEDLDRVKYILNDEKRIKIFTDNVSRFEWVLWLKENKYLDFLFLPACQLNEIQQSLCEWIAEKFIVSNTFDIAVMLGDKLSLLHPAFCDIVGRFLFYDESIPESIRNQWIVLLLGAGSDLKHVNPYYLNEIAKSKTTFPFICSATNNYLVSVPQQSSTDKTNFSIEIRKAHAHVTLRTGLLLDNLGDYQSIIYSCVSCIHDWYTMRKVLAGDNCVFDKESWDISAIEEHKQNNPCTGTFNVALLRDVLLKLDNHDHIAFLAWINILVKDPATLLKRIAVYAMGQSTETPDYKITWLLNNISIHEIGIHHEIYAFLSNCYKNIPEKLQIQLLETIQDQAKPIEGNNKEDNHQQGIEHKIFTMISWIKQNSPDDSKIDKILSPIKQKHPAWKVGEYGDFTHCCYIPEFKCVSPWSKEELYNLVPYKFIQKVTSYTPADGLDVSQDAIDDQVKEMVREDIEWGIKILKEIAPRNDEFQKLFSCICCSLAGVSISSRDADKIINIFSKISLTNEGNLKAIIRIYTIYIKNKNIRDDQKVLDAVRSDVLRIWDMLPRREMSNSFLGCWVSLAINNPFGMITELYMDDLGEDQKEKKLEINNIPSRYTDFFNLVCRDEQLPGHFGRTIMGCHFSQLAYWMPEWIKTQLCPLFADVKNEGLWEGTLSCSQITPRFYELLFPFFETRIKNKHDFSQEQQSLKKKFVRNYSIMLIFYVDNSDLFENHIPQLFDYLANDKYLFEATIRDILKDNPKEYNKELWNNKLKHFLERRMENKPVPPLPKEVEKIFEWAEYLDFAFDEYLDIIESFSVFSIPEHTTIINRLNRDTDVFRKFTPKQIGRFILIIIRNYDKSKSYTLRGIEDLVPKISSGLPEKLYNEIKIIASEKQINIG